MRYVLEKKIVGNIRNGAFRQNICMTTWMLFVQTPNDAFTSRGAESAAGCSGLECFTHRFTFHGAVIAISTTNSSMKERADTLKALEASLGLLLYFKPHRTSTISNTSKLI